ncbi:response regulator [Vibrio agarivorans]|uniref:Response regulator n=1 Tax=Vibrio agarivorans TaxID=153622 RepID=A0ABT7Y5K8_9VIBR|nr:response regulator [Vibrio agarivorans]MDN2483285.1 response regulator [Vibrio agarivorans]
MILIVEDEPHLAQLLADYLQHHHFDTHIIEDGALAIDWVKAHTPTLIILDLMLPNRDGLDIYRELRTFSDVPVMMATAKVDEIDRLVGLELGADDYVCKPYSPREVVARVKNVLRRYKATHSAEPEKMPLRIESSQMRVWVVGQEVSLTPAEFQLLEHFYQHKGIVFNRNQLMDKIYNDGRVVTDRTIDSHIKNLRKKLQEVSQEADWIHSIYGVGYRFDL